MKNKFLKKLPIFLVFIMLFSIVSPNFVGAATYASDLIISEYIEGSSNNKAIEIYNGTGQTINLNSYTIELYTNGATTANNKLILPSTDLANGATYVIVHTSAVAALKSKGNLTNGTVTAFNGNDAIVLKKGTTIIDSLGQVGNDPGTAWGTSVKTMDQTLIRKSNITSGDTNPSNAFDPAVEWDGNPIDTFTNLGSHTMVLSPTKVDAVTSTVASGPVHAGTKIQLLTQTTGATIYYTTNGDSPTTESTSYTSPITINQDTVIKALATASGSEASDISTFYYTIIDQTAPNAPVVNPVTDADEVIKGTAEADSTVTAKVNDQVIGSAKADTTGVFEFEITKQTAGTIIFVVAKDAAGNKSKAAEITVTDVTAPDAPDVNPVSDADEVISGTAEAGTTVIAKVNDEAIGQASTDSNGQFEIQIEKQTAKTKIFITAEDSNGNISTATELQVTRAVPQVDLVSLVVDKASPQLLGSSVTLKATSEGSINPEYRFFIKENGVLTTLQEYSSNNTVTWTPSKTGTYTIIVHAKDKSTYGENYKFEARTEMNFVVFGGKVTNVSISTDQPSPQLLGKPVTIKAISKGSIDPEYRFYIYEDGVLTTLQEYGSNNTVTWTPSKTGAYTIIVHAKDRLTYGKNYNFEARTEMKYVVNGGKVTSVNLSTDKPSPQLLGVPITINAQSEGSIEPEYRFYIRDENGVLTTLQEYSNSDTITWTPSKTGAYTIIVHSKDKNAYGGNYNYESRTEMKYVVNGGKVTSVNISTDQLSLQPLGQPITLKAQSVGSIEPEYRFFVLENGVLTTIQEYDSNDTISWVPTKPGSYKIIVHSKDKSKYGGNYQYEARSEINLNIN